MIMLKRLTLMLIILVGFIFNVNSQCNIDVTKPTQDTTICAGDSLKLVSDGSCTFMMNNTLTWTRRSIGQEILLT